MEAASLEGGFAAPPVDAARAFRSALRALSRPGQIEQVSGAKPPPPLSVAAGVLLLTLADHDTPVWLAPSMDQTAIRDWLAFHTGAPIAGRANCQFAVGPWEELAPLSDFQIGTPEYPDRSASLIVEVPDFGRRHRLTGPGIEREAWLTLPDAEAFKLNSGLFPLGLDFFLTTGDRLAGVPRTAKVGG